MPRLDLLRIGALPIAAFFFSIACSDDASLGSDAAKTSSSDGLDGSSAGDPSSSASSSSGSGVGGGPVQGASASAGGGPVQGASASAGGGPVQGASASAGGGPVQGASASAGGGPVEGASASVGGGPVEGASASVGGGPVDTSSGSGGAASGGSSGSAGSAGSSCGGSSTGGAPGCEAVECLRPYECAASCDADPVYVGCCPCETGLIDQFIECRDACQNGDTKEVDCNTCDCVDGAWACTDMACLCGGETCSANAYCAKPAGMCDAASDSGSCAPMPEGCTADYAPVCGCDGQTYSNDCAAASAGVNVSAEGECPSN